MFEIKTLQILPILHVFFTWARKLHNNYKTTANLSMTLHVVFVKVFQIYVIKHA